LHAFPVFIRHCRARDHIILVIDSFIIRTTALLTITLATHTRSVRSSVRLSVCLSQNADIFDKLNVFFHLESEHRSCYKFTCYYRTFCANFSSNETSGVTAKRQMSDIWRIAAKRAATWATADYYYDPIVARKESRIESILW